MQGTKWRKKARVVGEHSFQKAQSPTWGANFPRLETMLKAIGVAFEKAIAETNAFEFAIG